jgi:hypothetical protein
MDWKLKEHQEQWPPRELFETDAVPFNLAGELIDNATTDEGEARVRALAEAEARRAQQAFPSLLESAEQERRTFEPAAQPYPNHRRCMNCETLVHKRNVSTHDCSKRFERPYR